MTEDEVLEALKKNRGRGPLPEHDALLLNAIDSAALRIRRRRWFAYAAAASIVAAVGLGIMTSQRDDITVPVMRDDATSASPSRYELLTQAPMELRWDDVSNEAPYSLEMFDSSGVRIWKLDGVSETVVRLSQPQRDAITQDGEYYWVVTTANGVDLGPFWFRLNAE